MVHVFLTGATGFVGGALAQRLVADGVAVTALVRSEEAAAKAKALGVTPLLGEITDKAFLLPHLRAADGVIHTASPSDANSAAVDTAFSLAVIEAFAGTTKPYVHTGGVWVFGATPGFTEESPFDPPAITAWRPAVEKVVREAGGRIVAPGVVYGRGAASIIGVIVHSPRTADGALTMVGDGKQTWTTVHVDDLADLYVRVFRQGANGGYYIGVSGQNPTMHELCVAASKGLGIAAAPVPSTKEEVYARLGPYFGEALLVSQSTTPSNAALALGWVPSRPSLVDELAAGFK